MIMNETESNSPQSGDLASQVAALQRQVFTLLLALIVVSGTLTVYLYRQDSVTRKDIDSIRPKAEQIISAFNQTRPAMQAFVKQLTDYGMAHPDFQPILKKYGLMPAPATNAAAKPSTAPPTMPAPPKK
jgi:hypothetical protein